jgi:hypothetical protein
VQVYAENIDPCGDYHGHLYGVPSSQPLYLNVKSTGDPPDLLHCGNGVPYYGSLYQYKKGSSSNSPFFYGVMSTDDGQAGWSIETHNNASQPTTYLGCRTTSDCTDSDYGLQIQAQNGNWNTCCSVQPENYGPSNPPFMHNFQNWWSMKTCQTQC